MNRAYSTTLTLLVIHATVGLTGCFVTNSAPTPAAGGAAVKSPVAPSETISLPAEKGAPAVSPTAKYMERTTQVLEAATKGQLSLIEELLTQGANVNDKDDEGQTALHRAAAHGHKSVVVALLMHGADLNEKDKLGRTPLMAAAAMGNTEIVTLLQTPQSIVGMAKTFAGSVGSGLKLDFESFTNQLATAGEAALKQTDLEGHTPLMLAAMNGHTGCVEQLAPYNFDYNSHLRTVDKQGRNCFMLAAAAGHTNHGRRT